MLRDGAFWIRAIEHGDLGFVFKIRRDPEMFDCLGSFRMLSMDGQQAWLDALEGDSSRACFIFGCGTKRIGYVRVSDIDWINRSMCVGGDIARRYRGRGYGKQMYGLVFNLGFDKWNMNRLWLKVMETNGVARRLYRKCGFVEEGIERDAILRDGKAVDYIMMSILEKEYVG